MHQHVVQAVKSLQEALNLTEKKEKELQSDKAQILHLLEVCRQVANGEVPPRSQKAASKPATPPKTPLKDHLKELITACKNPIGVAALHDLVTRRGYLVSPTAVRHHCMKGVARGEYVKLPGGKYLLAEKATS